MGIRCGSSLRLVKSFVWGGDQWRVGVERSRGASCRAGTIITGEIMTKESGARSQSLLTDRQDGREVTKNDNQAKACGMHTLCETVHQLSYHTVPGPQTTQPTSKLQGAAEPV